MRMVTILWKVMMMMLMIPCPKSVLDILNQWLGMPKICVGQRFGSVCFFFTDLAVESSGSHQIRRGVLVSFPFFIQANSGDGTVGGVEASVEAEVEYKDLYSQIIHDTYSQIIHDVNDATSDIFKYRTIGVVCFGNIMLLKEKEKCSGRSGSKGTSDTSKSNNI